MRLFCLAAAQGHAAAQYQLGSAFEHGEGVAQDQSEAVRWYRCQWLYHAVWRCTILYARAFTVTRFQSSSSSTPGRDAPPPPPPPRASFYACVSPLRPRKTRISLLMSPAPPRCHPFCTLCKAVALIYKTTGLGHDSATFVVPCWLYCA